MPDDAREDPLFFRTNGKERGRDGCRIPLPWTDDATTSYGFSPAKVEPWLPQPPDWGDSSVAKEIDDAGSMLHWYRTLLTHRPMLAGDLVWVEIADPNCLAFERNGVLVVANVGSATVELPAELVAGRSVIVATQPDTTSRRLPSDTCVWLSTVD